MIAILLLVCFLLAVAAIEYFPGNNRRNVSTASEPDSRSSQAHRSILKSQQARRRISQVVGKTLRKKLTWRDFVFASIDGYHVIPLGICIGVAMALLTLLATGVLH